MVKLPADFITLLNEAVGKDECASIVDMILNSEPRIAVRTNPLKWPKNQNDLLSQKIVSHLKPYIDNNPQIPWAKDGLYLESRPNFTLDPAFHAGAYYVQEPAFMMIEIFEQLVANSSRVLDLCAAPGGKSTHLATMLAEDAVLIANEVIRGRVSVLRENIDKWGDGRVTVTSFDPSLFKYKYREGFDFILVDAPCSGEGLFRKNPKAISEWSLRAVNECAARQRRIVTDIWSTLEPGGYLSYATCTMNRIENEDNVAWFAENLDAEIINLAPFLKHKDDVIVNESGAIRLHPSLFLSLLRKRGSGVRRRARVKSRSRGEVPEYWEALRVGAEWPSAELSKEQALAYLSREILVLPDAPIGYLMVTYGGLGLGFVKNIGSRANNLLPKSMRILNR